MAITPTNERWRTIGAALFAVLLIVSAGCAGIGGQEDGDAADGPDSTDAPDDPSSESDGDDGDGDADASQGGADETDSGDGTESDGDGESEADRSDPRAPPEGADLGEMRVVIGDQELDLAERGDPDDGFWFAYNPETVWISDEHVTLSDALEGIGVETDGETLTYEGTTYDGADEDTEIHVRVNGEEKDPSSYTLKDGDEVWIVAETEETGDVERLDSYVPENNLHLHGSMEFTVDGESVDFGESRFQGLNAGPYFHFHGNESQPWHAHSWGMHLDYALSTLDGISVSDETVTYEGEEYALDDDSVTLEVNGEAVTPSEHVLKDGDDITVEIETDDAATNETG